MGYDNDSKASRRNDCCVFPSFISCFHSDTLTVFSGERASSSCMAMQYDAGRQSRVQPPGGWGCSEAGWSTTLCISAAVGLGGHGIDALYITVNPSLHSIYSIESMSRATLLVGPACDAMARSARIPVHQFLQCVRAIITCWANRAYDAMARCARINPRSSIRSPRTIS